MLAEWPIAATSALRIDADQLFLAIAVPLRWSLVSPRIQNFAGNRYGRRTLTDLEAGLSTGE